MSRTMPRRNSITDDQVIETMSRTSPRQGSITDDPDAAEHSGSATAGATDSGSTHSGTYDNGLSSPSYAPSSPRYDYNPSFSPQYDYSPSPFKRKRSEVEIPDRISDLPDSILLHIFSFLPTEDAVKTGVLARRWAYLWTSVPTLHFCDRRSPGYGGAGNFCALVTRTLVLRGSSRSRIKRFKVEFEYEEGCASDVDLWIRFATRKEVEELELNFSDRCRRRRYALPQHIYGNSFFTKISLSLCNLKPSGLISWNSLKSLSIGYVGLSEDLMQKILLGCPALEYLELYMFVGIGRLNIINPSVKKLVIRDYWCHHWCSGDKDDEDENSWLEISGPDLISLEILGCLRRKKCRVINVASLVEANLNFYLSNYPGEDVNYQENQNMLIEILETINHVEKLTIGTWCIEVLFTLEMEDLRAPLSRRKHLTLATCITKWDLPGIAILLRSSPKLETLVINKDPLYHPPYFCFRSTFRDYCNFDGEFYWTFQKKIFKCVVQHLKTVKVVGFNQGNCLLEFVEFLLKNAKVLEKLIVNARSVGYDRVWKLFDMAEKLLSFPRSSPHAVIKFSYNRVGNEYVNLAI